MAVFTVSNLNDSGAGSLRAAILAAAADVTAAEYALVAVDEAGCPTTLPAG